MKKSILCLLIIIGLCKFSYDVHYMYGKLQPKNKMELSGMNWGYKMTKWTPETFYKKCVVGLVLEIKNNQ